MKLGIAVVYLLQDEDGPLLDLHLARIRRHTSVPYRIYGVANRLQAKFRDKLERSPDVAIVCDATRKPFVNEAVHYYETAIDAAIADGVTHVAVLHVDSFPVADGWVERISSQLNETTVLAAVQRLENDDHKPMTAFMMFRSQFVTVFRPGLLLDSGTMGTAMYSDYLGFAPHTVDGGVGYGFKIFQEGLEWVALNRTNVAEDHYLIGSIYGDMFFHLGAAARPWKVFYHDRLAAGLEESGASPTRGTLRRTAGRVLNRLFRWFGVREIDKAAAANRTAYDRVRDRLLSDPDRYLAYLRGGEW